MWLTFDQFFFMFLFFILYKSEFIIHIQHDTNMFEKYLQGKEEVSERENLWFTSIKIILIKKFWYFIVNNFYSATTVFFLL